MLVEQVNLSDDPVHHRVDNQALRSEAAARQVGEVHQVVLHLGQTERVPPEGPGGRRRKHLRKPRRSPARSRLRRARKQRNRHRARSRRRLAPSRSRCVRPAPPSRNQRRSSSLNQRRRRNRRLGRTCSKGGTSRATTSHLHRLGICWQLTSLNGPFYASCKRMDGPRGSHVGYWMGRRCADVGGLWRHQLHCMWTWPAQQEGASGF